MLPELKDLVARGLFTRVRLYVPPADLHLTADAAQHEMQEIVKKRTALESALVRRAPRTADFLAYVAYEARLEALRRKRVARLRAPSPPCSVRTSG
jgi:U3 small nucleolar RNA-associated protein 6